MYTRGDHHQRASLPVDCHTLLLECPVERVSLARLVVQDDETRTSFLTTLLLLKCPHAQPLSKSLWPLLNIRWRQANHLPRPLGSVSEGFDTYTCCLEPTSSLAAQSEDSTQRMAEGIAAMTAEILRKPFPFLSIHTPAVVRRALADLHLALAYECTVRQTAEQSLAFIQRSRAACSCADRVVRV